MTWLSIHWLWGVPLVWMLIWLVYRYQEYGNSWQQWLEPHLLNAMIQKPATHNSSPRWFWLSGGAISLLIIALAGPSWQQVKQPLLVSAQARVLIIDLSYSMLATDVAPNRVGWAKQFLRDQLNDDFEGETALIAFSGQAFVVSPLTRDFNTLRRFIAALQPGQMPVDGNRLDLALRQATDILSTSPSGRGRITVISDGIDARSANREATAVATEAGLELVFIAVGTPEGSPLPAQAGGLLRNDADEIIIAPADFGMLRDISAASGGLFLEYSDSKPLLPESVFSAEPGVADNPDQDSFASTAENGGFWLLWLVLPCLLLLFRKNALPVLVIAVLFVNAEDVSAAEWSAWWFNDNQRAWQSLGDGLPAEAAATADDPILRAHALYQLGDYRAVLELPGLRENADGLYLRGNAMVQLDLLRQALESYRQAINLRSDFAAARYNLVLIELYLDQQSVNEDSNESSGVSSTADDYNPDQGNTRNSTATTHLDGEGGENNQGGLGASIARELAARPDSEVDAAVIDAELQQIIANLQNESPIPQQDLLASWAKTLNTDLGELFQRKFLRDYQRATGDR